MSSCGYDHRHPIPGIPTPLSPEVKTHAHVLTPICSQGHPDGPLTDAQEYVCIESSMLRWALGLFRFRLLLGSQTEANCMHSCLILPFTERSRLGSSPFLCILVLAPFGLPQATVFLFRLPRHWCLDSSLQGVNTSQNISYPKEKVHTNFKTLVKVS